MSEISLLKRTRAMNRFVNTESEWKGEFLFDQFDGTGPSGSPPEVVPNIPEGPNRNGPFAFDVRLKFPGFLGKSRRISGRCFSPSTSACS